MRYMIRLSSLTALILALLSGAALFWVSQQVQQVEREQRQLLASLDQEEESIRVLKAEWDYLNRPERLEELSARYLKMAPASADTLVQSISAIPEPEDSTSGPDDLPMTVSTAPAKKPAAVKTPSAVLPPPTLNENEVPDEDDFGKVLDDTTKGGQ